jgi:O-antigen ligase
MSNIATLRKTRLAPGVTDAIWAALPTMIAALILTVLLLSFAPFAAGSVILEAEPPAGSNKINQIGYSLLGIIAVLSVMTLAKPEQILKIPRVSWAVLVGVYLFAIVNSPDKGAALRAVMFSMIAVMTVISVIMLVKDERSLQRILATACLSILGICYFGVFAMPEAARHLGEIFEPANEGLWRGIYPHKNMAGPVMAVFVFVGVYLLRSGQRQMGIAVTLLSVVFLLQSGSKTSAATVFLVLTIILLPSIIGLRGLGLILFAIILAAFATFTIGSLLFKPVHELLEAVAPGANFTGRLTLWEFAISKIREYPLTGYGLDSLWGKPVVMEMETPYDSAWDFRGIVHGHSSYLDAVLELGIPGACVVFFVVIIQPSIDYLRARPLRANIYAADFFMMVIVFTSLNAFMETFFFRRADPVWMMMVLGIAGLRLTTTASLSRNSA